MKANQLCLVLDLDDTLYQEYDYQTSGLKYVEQMIEHLYQVSFAGKLIQWREQGIGDVFAQACRELQQPASFKEHLLNFYRYHLPDISLSQTTQSFLNHARRHCAAVAILTDGRSATQRLKLKALGLSEYPVYISEEWHSTKPCPERFLQIQYDFAQCEQFCYLGDNPKKDFLAPNELGWFSVGLRGNERNIHSQDTSLYTPSSRPAVWIEQLTEFFDHVEH